MIIMIKMMMMIIIINAHEITSEPGVELNSSQPWARYRCLITIEIDMLLGAFMSFDEIDK